MKTRLTAGLLTLVTVLFWNKLLPATETANPLDPFQVLVGGQWHIEGSYQVFEWGPGRSSVNSRSYIMVNGNPHVTSQGFWYWHPGEQQIKGVFTAVGMPDILFEYSTLFLDNRMMNDLRTYDIKGNMERYVETWMFTSEDSYTWKLEKPVEDGLKPVMEGVFIRR